MKKIICSFLAMSLVVGMFNLSACASDDITVVIDGEKLDCTAQIIDGSTMVPMRSVFEAVGMDVNWEKSNSEILATEKDDTIIMRVGENSATINGATITSEVAPTVIGGVTYVPIRFVAEALGYDVNYDKTTRTVTIESEEKVNDEAWKENTGTIDLDNMTVTGDGVEVKENIIYISEGGDFEVVGTLEDGMIQVNTEDRVKLRLSGANITNSAGPAIFFENTDKSYITITADTQNVLTDGESYAVEAKGTIFSNSDLEIKGSGSLTINANYKHGISCDDELDIEDGSITINANVNDGINTNDGVYIVGGDITITSEGDGISSEGYIDIEAGSVNIKTVGEVSTSSSEQPPMGGGGFNKDQSTEMTTDEDGNPVMPSGGMGGHGRNMGESTEMTTDENGNTVMPSGGMPMGEKPTGDMEPPTGDMELPTGEQPTGDMEPPTGEQTTNTEANSETTTENSWSSKGIKAGTNLVIAGGDININSTDHAVHSADVIIINDGDINIVSSSGKGISGHGNVFINGGNIDIDVKTEGIESKAIMTINDGDINITAQDDGLNAGGGNAMGMGARNSTDTVYEQQIVLNGGDIYIYASGDGIDSNGALEFNGANVVIDGPTSGGESALDSDGTMSVAGGEIMAVGSSGMLETPSAEVTSQNVLVYAFETAYDAGNEIVIKNSSGTVITSFTPKKAYQAVIYSSANIKSGETYTVYINGEEVSSVTVESTVSSVGTKSGGMQGGGGMPQMGNRTQGDRTQQTEETTN